MSFKKIISIIFLSLFVLGSNLAFAADSATVIFKSGQVVTVPNGYEKIVENLRSLQENPSRPEFVELNVNSGSFLLSLKEVALVCRDDCSDILVKHQQSHDKKDKHVRYKLANEDTLALNKLLKPVEDLPTKEIEDLNALDPEADKFYEDMDLE